MNSISQESATPRKKTWKVALKNKGNANTSNSAIRYLRWIFIAVLLWGIYFFSPLSKPQSIELVGNVQVSAEDIQNNTGIKKGMSIWGILADHQNVSRRLQEANPKIKAASVTMTSWNQLRLTVTENPAVGYFIEDNQSYELLADQQIIQVEEITNRDSYPIVVDFSKEQLQQLAEQLDKVSPQVLALVNRIEYAKANGNSQKIYLKMKDGLRVIGSLKDIGDKLNYYPSVVQNLKNKVGTIDMEVGIFYTPDVNAQ